jgi:hypothetical protein
MHWQLNRDKLNPFPELIWRETLSGIWKPHLTAPSNHVARFGAGNMFEFREYKADLPW